MPSSAHGIVSRYVCDELFMVAETARILGDYSPMYLLVVCSKTIIANSDPSQYKSLGRKVSGFDHASWQLRCEDVVFSLLHAKFAQNADGRERLLVTGDRPIAEPSPFDTLWSILVSMTLPVRGRPLLDGLVRTSWAKGLSRRARSCSHPVKPNEPLRPERSAVPPSVCPTMHEISPSGDGSRRLFV